MPMRDGYGDDSPATGVTAGTDCNDAERPFSPGATELTGDEVDQDCDGTEICYADADDDGYTDGSSTVSSTDTDCSDAGEGTSSDPTGECDDADATVNPGATELTGRRGRPGLRRHRDCYADARRRRLHRRLEHGFFDRHRLQRHGRRHRQRSHRRVQRCRRRGEPWRHRADRR